MDAAYQKTLMGRRVKASVQVERLLNQVLQSPSPRETEQVDRAVMFTDIVGSTAYFEQYGDQAGLAMVERHNRLLFPHIINHQGVIVKTIGDAIMAGFPSAHSAVSSAVSMQKVLRRHNQTQSEQEQIQVRIGINCGPVLCHGGDLFGDVVNAAARVESLARGGQILVASAVENQLGDSFEPARVIYDAVRLKGKQELIQVYEVRWDPDAKPIQSGHSDRLTPGTTLQNRFEIISALGEGGMGQVYLALDRALGEKVALKFIRPDQAMLSKTLEKFKSEVRLARSVTHPNICRIYEFLEMEGRVFLSMEWVRGQTLEELLKKNRTLRVSETLHISEGICLGLKAAHERGIAHRDLKPENVMIEDASRRVILMDFGIARLGRTHADPEVSLEGTPEYMSPEQVNGTSAGPASDIYSLGVMLYEMLSGSPPHEAGSPVETAIRHLTCEPQPLENRRPDLPAYIVQAVHRCLNKDPARRFHHPLEVFEALGGVSKRAATKRFTRYLTWGGVLLILTTLLFRLDILGADGPASHAWSSRVLVSSRQVDTLPRISPKDDRIVFVRNGDLWMATTGGDVQRLTSIGSVEDLEGAGGLCFGPDDAEVFFTAKKPGTHAIERYNTKDGYHEPILDGAMGADLNTSGDRLVFSQPNAFAGFDLAVSRLDGTERRIILPGDIRQAFIQPRWSPDGERIVVVRHLNGYQSTRDIGVVELERPGFRPLTRDGALRKAYNTDPTWTPDGKWILYASKRTGNMSIWQVDASGGESKLLVPASVHDYRRPDVSRDAKHIVFATHEQQMDIALQDMNGRLREITSDVWADRFPVFSPQGDRVAYRTQHSADPHQPRAIILVDLKTGQEKKIPVMPGARDFCWCDHGIYYAATQRENRLLAHLNPESGRSTTLVDHFYRLWSPTCNQKDNRVAFVGQKNQKMRRSLWMLANDHTTLRQMGQIQGFVSYPVFSPNGKSLAYRWARSERRLGEAELRLQATQPSGRARTVTRHRSFLRSQRRIRFSGNGKQLYYMEALGTKGKCWSIATRGGGPSLLFEPDDVHTLDFDISPDGRNLVYARVLRRGDIVLMNRTD